MSQHMPKKERWNTIDEMMSSGNMKPKCSMYGIIYQQFTLKITQYVGKYTIHGAYGTHVNHLIFSFSIILNSVDTGKLKLPRDRCHGQGTSISDTGWSTTTFCGRDGPVTSNGTCTEGSQGLVLEKWPKSPASRSAGCSQGMFSSLLEKKRSWNM